MSSSLFMHLCLTCALLWCVTSFPMIEHNNKPDDEPLELATLKPHKSWFSKAKSLGGTTLVRVIQIATAIPLVISTVLGLVQPIINVFTAKPTIPPFETVVTSAEFWERINQIQEEEEKLDIIEELKRQHSQEEESTNKPGYLDRLAQMVTQYWYLWLLVLVLVPMVAMVLLINNNRRAKGEDISVEAFQLILPRRWRSRARRKHKNNKQT